MTKFRPSHSLTQDHLRSLLYYDKETGVFTWVKARSRIRIGAVAGSTMPNGYVRITIDGHRFMAHTLAWLWVTGEYVARGLDHRDTNPSNNRWENLRKATPSQNSMNTNVRSDNITGIKCVRYRSYGKRKKRYYSTIRVDGKQKHFGYFLTAEEAAEAYAKAAKEYFGEFARLK